MLTSITRIAHLEEARRIAADEDQRLSALENQITQADIVRRERIEENSRLEAETRTRLKDEQDRFARLQREARVQQQRAEEHERSLERVRQLHAETDTHYRRESEQLSQELAGLHQANEEVSRLRAEVESARRRSKHSREWWC